MLSYLWPRSVLQIAVDATGILPQGAASGSAPSRPSYDVMPRGHHSVSASARITYVDSVAPFAAYMH